MSCGGAPDRWEATRWEGAMGAGTGLFRAGAFFCASNLAPTANRASRIGREKLALEQLGAIGLVSPRFIGMSGGIFRAETGQKRMAANRRSLGASRHSRLFRPHPRPSHLPASRRSGAGGAWRRAYRHLPFRGARQRPAGSTGRQVPDQLSVLQELRLLPIRYGQYGRHRPETAGHPQRRAAGGNRDRALPSRNHPAQPRTSFPLRLNL